MQLKLSVRTVDGIAIVDASGRIVFGDEKTLRGFDATLKFAAVNAGQQP